MAVYTPEHRQRMMRWYAPARFGLFYHWGLYTGGGCSAPPGWGDIWYKDFVHPTVADLERAAPDPDAVARAMVGLATYVGARYIIYTVMHPDDHYAAMYPSTADGLVVRTSLDYLGAFCRQCRQRDIYPILYVPGSPQYWHCNDGDWLAEGFRDQDGYRKLLLALVAELAERYGEIIGGFWFDIHDRQSGASELARRLLPDAIIGVNCDTAFNTPECDYGTSEVTTGPLDPPYCRPSALRKMNPWGSLPPKQDFNEDIPTCNQWWHGSPFLTEEQMDSSAYVQDPTFMVKEMVSSLGQRGQWNYAHGIGPQIDGTPPPRFQPMLDNMHRFMAWAGESIYGTTGGEGSLLPPGWCAGDGFLSVTISHADPRVYYLHVTTAPSRDSLTMQHNGCRVKSVTDLRTGQTLQFALNGPLDIEGVDWADVAEYGDKVFKLVME